MWVSTDNSSNRCYCTKYKSLSTSTQLYLNKQSFVNLHSNNLRVKCKIYSRLPPKGPRKGITDIKVQPIYQSEATRRYQNSNFPHRTCYLCLKVTHRYIYRICSKHSMDAACTSTSLVLQTITTTMVSHIDKLIPGQQEKKSDRPSRTGEERYCRIGHTQSASSCSSSSSEFSVGRFK